MAKKNAFLRRMERRRENEKSYRPTKRVNRSKWGNALVFLLLLILGSRISGRSGR